MPIIAPSLDRRAKCEVLPLIGGAGRARRYRPAAGSPLKASVPPARMPRHHSLINNGTAAEVQRRTGHPPSDGTAPSSDSSLKTHLLGDPRPHAG